MERLRRTMLFIPGGNEKALRKGLGLDVDSLILDLEDSVALEKKTSARETYPTSQRYGIRRRGHDSRVAG